LLTSLNSVFLFRQVCSSQPKETSACEKNHITSFSTLKEQTVPVRIHKTTSNRQSILGNARMLRRPLDRIASSQPSPGTSSFPEPSLERAPAGCLHTTP
jgi:hypothetical protein